MSRNEFRSSFFSVGHVGGTKAIESAFQELRNKINALVEAHNMEVERVGKLKKRIDKLEEEVRSLKPQRKLTIPGAINEQEK